MASKFHSLVNRSSNGCSVDSSGFKRRVAKRDINFFSACMRGDSIIQAAQSILCLPKGQSMDAYRWMLDQLASHARSKGLFSVPRLLRIVLPRDRLEVRLKEFGLSAMKDGAERGTGQFEAERSLPIDGLSRIAREIRVVRRQEAQIRKLAEWIVGKPGLEDPMHYWFDTTVSARFESVGIATIGFLLEFLNGAPVTWHKRIRGLGRPSANYVTQWMHDHALDLGVSPAVLPPSSQASGARVIREKSAGIAPLEAFLVPDEFDGRQGENRGKFERCQIPVLTDVGAITYWLEGFKGRSTAFNAYRHEAERVLLWSTLTKKKAFSSLTPADCDEYLNDFLSDIKPVECWIGKRVPRTSEHWRPFVGQLTIASRLNARKALFTLGEYLSKQRYLRVNPFYTVSLRDKGKPRPLEADGFEWRRGKVTLSGEHLVRRRRVISESQWKMVLDCADCLSNHVPANARLQFALRFGWESGLSRAELAELSSSELYVSRKDGGGLWLYVRANGHRGPTRFIPLGEGATRALVDYFELRGHGRVVREWPPGLPLLPVIAHGRQIVTNRPMSADGVNKMFKVFLTKVAAQFKSSDPEFATILTSVTTRWMRESFASNCIKAGMPIHEVAYLIGDRNMQSVSSQGTIDLHRHDLEAVAFSEQGLRDLN